MRVFAIYDPTIRKRHACAWLLYEPGDDAYAIEIAEDATPEELPLALALVVQKGSHRLDGAAARAWAESRMFSAARRDLADVLAGFGLVEFYLPSLLAATGGRSSDDDFLLQEVPDRDYRDAPIAEAPRAPEDLGVALGRARRAAGMTQAQLAEKCGIQQAALSRIEHGRGNPTLSTLETIARGVGRHLRIELE